MTLFKQMALGVSLLILTILGAVMIQNYQSAKTDMVEALYQITVNNISTLSNKLSENASTPEIMKSVINSQTNIKRSEADKTPAIIRSIIDSEFDSGYYKLIEIKSDKFDYKQFDNSRVEGIPAWFIKFADIKLKPITAEVNSGWSVLGTLTVIPDSTIIYKALYKTFENLLYLFSIFSIIALLSLSIMLHLILKPVKMIKKQADAILNNEFILQKKEPYTTEFKEVSFAMNSMVTKVQEIFNKANIAAKRNKELLYNDPITKLYNRRYLMLKLPELITLEGKMDGGTVILLSLNKAQIINKILGRIHTDELFYKLAKLFKESTKAFPDSIVSRINGTEFILVLPNCHTKEAVEIAENIMEGFRELLKKNDIHITQVCVGVGIYRYRPDVSVSELLTRADTALLKANVDECNHIHVYKEQYAKESLSKTQWRSILEESIKENHFKIKFFSTINSQTKAIVHKVITFNIVTNNAKEYQYSEFIAPAINLGMTTVLYLKMLEHFFIQQKKDIDTTRYVIRLPKELLQDEDSFEALSHLFVKYAKKIKYRLCFEVTDSFAIHDTATVKGYIDLFKKYNFCFSINSFTGGANDFEYLKEINPEYIKADVNFLLDQSNNSMSALQLIADSLNIEIIANFVNSEEEVKQLQKHQITKIQGPIVDIF